MVYQKTVSNVNQCSFVCPHATIRPILATEAEVAAAPEHFDTIPALGAKDLQFRIAVSPLDCLGCGNCVDICPAPKGKAIVMTSIDSKSNKLKHGTMVLTFL